MPQFVAVYGSLRKGLGNHTVMQRAGGQFVSNASLKLPFKMLSLGGFPGLIPDTNKNSIHVEVYKVPDEGMSHLDRLEGYPSFYNRTQIKELDGAWIYFLTEAYRDGLEVVESGDWLEYCKNKYI